MEFMASCRCLRVFAATSKRCEIDIPRDMAESVGSVRFTGLVLIRLMRRSTGLARSVVTLLVYDIRTVTARIIACMRMGAAAPWRLRGLRRHLRCYRIIQDGGSCRSLGFVRRTFATSC